MYSIGKLAKDFSLSRSTLLYYHKLGLLSPSARSAANYRLYSKEDYQRLQQVQNYKEAGLSLESIKALLDSEPLDSQSNRASQLLEQRLQQINADIYQLRQQQQSIIQLLGKDSLLRQCKFMDKQQWVNLLRASGMDDDDMQQWHVQFEKAMPQAHQDFLESLGIDEKEIKMIRAESK